MSYLCVLLRGPINQAVLHHYIDFFDFSGLRLDVAFRYVLGFD
jgi:Sec7-like guanine-nucleotide exchange factor